MSRLYELTVKTITGQDWQLGALKGKVVLFVNVASKCGFAKQYHELENLYSEYKDQGFEVIGVPCNQFNNQEPGSGEEILKLVKEKYNKSNVKTRDVNGSNESPLYKFLKESKSGILGLHVVKWNFEKFLVDRSGHVVHRYSSMTDPHSIASEIEKLLQRK
ncbi:hypothetical protein G6F23_003746 [Rhizopus arrhizus]|nr:hypothetical protein G6F23_003746 [Rhizopus arrhizus]KAG0760244.1 hypothetical protein G6F24_008468 [Rhizopus arrhizus]